MPNDNPFISPERPSPGPPPDVRPSPLDTGESNSSIPIPQDMLDAGRESRSAKEGPREPCAPTPDMPGWAPNKK